MVKEEGDRDLIKEVILEFLRSNEGKELIKEIARTRIGRRQR